MDALLEKAPMILAVLLGLSEALAHIPQVKANSVFQLASRAIASLSKLFAKKEALPQESEKKEEESKPEDAQ